MKILCVASEMSPLAATGGLGDVVGALPKALNALGHDARVVIPLYRTIRERYGDALTFIRWTMIRVGWRTMYSGLYRMTVDGVTVYLIDNEFYFGHDALYVDYSFDIERFSFFQRAVLEAMGVPMDFTPDVLHVHDWQTAMIPVLLESHYKANGYFTHLPVLLTIHNLKFQGVHGREVVSDLLELPAHCFDDGGVMNDGVPNFLKAGIVYANRVTTVSPTYAQEIMTSYYGEGLSGVLNAYRWKVCGIVNGIDDVRYNPATDPALDVPYSKRAFVRAKAHAKRTLGDALAVPTAQRRPLFAMVSRLTAQKGVDLLLHIADEWLATEDVTFVVLGTGERRYEDALRGLEARHHDRMRVVLAFDPTLARRLYAAADAVIMPSLFEPCGLTQLIAMRYGALPIVRQTGGLADTVEPYNRFTDSGTGFGFANINAHELLFTAQAAAALYRNDQAAWRRMVRRALAVDSSWSRSALRYVEIYKTIVAEAGG